MHSGLNAIPSCRLRTEWQEPTHPARQCQTGKRMSAWSWHPETEVKLGIGEDYCRYWSAVMLRIVCYSCFPQNTTSGLFCCSPPFQWTTCRHAHNASRHRPLSRRLDRCDRVIQNESRDPFRGNVYYVTMQIMFLTRKFRNGERNLHCDVVHITTKWVFRLTLDRNGVFAIKAYKQRRGFLNFFLTTVICLQWHRALF